ncbi:MAG: FixH family protein [Desulfuromonadales bacterium]|nr:FixH family protein [Desulfuromonadales bacterium]
MKTSAICRYFVVTTCLMLLSCSLAFAGQGETILTKNAADGSKATIIFADKRLKTMTETDFAITLTGPSGVTIRDAKLHLSLDMPAMPMPPNHPKAVWQEEAYRGKVIFTMAGEWQVHLNVQRPGYEPQIYTFDIDMVVMK